MIRRAAESLSQAGIPGPVFEAELFLAHLLNTQRHNLYVDPPFVARKTERRFFNLIIKRCTHIPASYLLKNTYFYGYSFKIRQGVFIPRPETETIIDVVCKLFEDKTQSLKILDVCTGSGNLAIVLAKIFLNSEVVATDISRKAVNTARENVSLHGLENRVGILRADIFPDNIGKFDLIVSNPPYLTDDEMKSIPEEVRREPVKALSGGKTGLKYINKILSNAPRYLANGGFVILETGYNQSKFLRNKKFPQLKLTSIEKDFNGFERVGIFRKVIHFP